MPPRYRPLLVLLVTALLWGCSDPAPPEAGESSNRTAAAEPARPAPDFSLTTPDGTAVTLSELTEEVVVLNFWATWCAPCVAEVPELVALQETLAGQGVRVIGISQDEGFTAATDVRDFAEMFSVNYPMVLDPGQRIARQYGVSALPHTIVVDREGFIHASQIGLVSQEDVLRMLDGLLDDDTPDAEQQRPIAFLFDTPPDDGAGPPLSLEEAALLIDYGAMVIDLRPAALRAATGTLPYALPLETDTLGPESFPANLGTPIVVVGSDEAGARAVAEKIVRWGYAFARPLAGGFEAWVQAGYPVEDADAWDDEGAWDADVPAPLPLSRSTTRASGMANS